MRKPFKERKLFKGGNYMRKYGISYFSLKSDNITCVEMSYVLAVFNAFTAHTTSSLGLPGLNQQPTLCN